MSAVIQNEYTQQNNSTVLYSFTFPYLKTSDIKVSLDGVETTAFTLPNATQIQFNSVPAQNTKIKIFRQTSVDDLTATFYAGSAIKSEDLNDNFTQNLYKTQEVGGRFISNLGGTMTGDLNMGEDTVIKFEGAIDDAHETTLTVANPTADRTITLPNVTGTVVTTGDTGTVATGMIANDAITNAKIADNQIDSEHYVDGSIDRVHLAADIVDGTKIADDSINSEHYVADSIDSEHYAPGSVNTVAIENTAITTAKLAADAVTNAKIADNSIDSEHYVDGSIDAAHLANNSVTNAKMADDSVGTAELQDSSVDTARLADNAVTLAKMADNSVGTSEIVNDAVTNAKIADNSIDSEHYVDGSIDTAHISTGAITTAKISNSQVTSTKIADGNVNTNKLASSSVTTAKIANDAVTTVKIVNDAVTTAKIADSELKTLAGMQSGTASKLADSTALTADIADLNQIDGLTKQTTISDSDASFPTSGAVVDYVAAQIAPLGGLEVIATEVAFPNTQPASGVVISISDAGGVVFNGSGTSTTGRTVGGSTVTINNAPSSLNSETLVAGVGLMVSSTGSGQVYNYHKILGKEDDIKQLSDDINDFNARYRVGSSNPTSALDAGDLFFNTSTSKLLVYNATNTAWEEAQSIGNFFISTLSPAFDNSTQNFTITNAPTNAEQIILSINGVIQKPNAGTSTPSEGFALDGSTVKLAAAPPTGSTYFAVVVGSTVNIGQPSNNTVSTAVLQNGSVTSAKLAKPIDLADNEEIRFGTGNDLKIYHNGSGSYIADSGTGELILKSNSISFTNAAENEYLARFFEDNATQLYYNGSQKFATSNNGVSVTGNVFLADSTNSNNGRVVFGNSSDLQIYHDTHNPIINAGTNTLRVVADNIHLEAGDFGDEMLRCIHDGGVELYYDNSVKFTTTSTGAKVIGQLNFDDGSSTANTNGIGLGSSQDARIFHDGSSLQVRNTTGPVTFITPTRFQISADSSNDTMFKAIQDGPVELYNNNVKTFSTDANGIQVYGPEGEAAQILLYSDEGDDNADKWRIINNGSNFLKWQTYSSGAWQDTISAQGENQVRLFYNGSEKLNTGNHGISISGKIYMNNGNLQFGASGNGVDFSSTSDASGMTSELLDDYEEGTWSPVLQNSSGTITRATYQAGYYVKVGRIVHLYGRMDCNGMSTHIGGDTIHVGGFPFSSGSQGNSGDHLVSVWGGSYNYWENGYPSISIENNQSRHGLFIHRTPGSTGQGVYALPTGNDLGNGTIQLNFNLCMVVN